MILACATVYNSEIKSEWKVQEMAFWHYSDYYNLMQDILSNHQIMYQEVFLSKHCSASRSVVVIQASTGNSSWQTDDKIILPAFHTYACQCFYWKVCFHYEIGFMNLIYWKPDLKFYSSTILCTTGVWFVATVVPSSHDDLIFAKSWSGWLWLFDCFALSKLSNLVTCTKYRVTTK